jgi:adenylate cyclase
VARFERLLAEEYRKLEIRNEARAARYVAFIAALGTVVAAIVAWRVELLLGATLGCIGVAVGAYYLLVVPRQLARSGRVGWIRWLNVTLEVTLPAVVSIIDIHFMGGQYALHSSPPLLTFMAVFLSGLRRRRALCVYAGLLAAAEYMGVYGLARLDIPAPLLASTPVLSVEFAAFHSLYLAGTGVLAAVVAHAGTAQTRRVAAQLLEKERLGDLFGEYVSPKVLAQVQSGDLALLGERRRLTILFCDIRGFTPLGFAHPPEEVVGYLNRYFSLACDAVGRHGGMVNKFIGDGLLAVFGAPEPMPDHAVAAARAALEILQGCSEVARPDHELTRVGIAIHTGEVVLGSIGSPRRKDYTVIGDTVNLASRIEGLCKELDATILLSHAAVEEAGDSIRVEPRGEHVVRGRARPVRLFELTAVAETVDTA